MYFFTCGQPRRKTDRHVTGEKEKSGKKERVRRKNRFPLRHNNSTRSIPAHIRSYDNNGRSGAVTPSNTEP